MEEGSRKNTTSAQKNSTDDVSETASDTNSQTRYYDSITIEKDYLTKIYETINPPSKPTGYENVGNNPDKYQQVTYRKLEIIKSMQDGDITGFVRGKREDFEDPGAWNKVGHGHYSDVYSAKFKNKLHAIKVIKRADRTLMQTHFAVDQEAEVLVYLRHPNTLTLNGVYLPSDVLQDGLEEIFNNGIIITPFFPNGDVASYCRIRNKKNQYLSRDNNKCDLDIIVKWCHELASALAYLAEIPIIHRDVAARNCLLDDELNLKLSDFGMAKVMVHVREEQKNPQYNFANANECVAIPWAAPECLQQNICMPKSDVWSLGVTMWEFLTKCKERPYIKIKSTGCVSDYDSRKNVAENWQR